MEQYTNALLCFGLSGIAGRLLGKFDLSKYLLMSGDECSAVHMIPIVLQNSGTTDMEWDIYVSKVVPFPQVSS